MVSTTRASTAEIGSDLLAAAGHEEDRRVFERALEFARGVYGEKLLGTGEPAFEHALGLARNVAQLRLDADALVAGVLFAIPAYLPDAEDRLTESFGATVAALVSGIDRLNRLRVVTRAAALGRDAAPQAEVLRKMLLAMVADIRVVLLRLASRTQTLRWIATPFISASAALALGLLLSAVIGWQALAFTFAAFALTQIALILRLQGRASNGLHGFVAIGLAWLLGHAAFGELALLSALAALIFSFAYAAMLDLAQGAAATRHWLLPQIVLVIVLIGLQQPIASLALIALLVAQALLATVMHSRDFARAAQWWLMLAMLVVALGIR